MSKETQTLTAHCPSRSRNLRVAFSNIPTSKVDLFDELVDKEVPNLKDYNRVDATDEWSSFQKLIGK